MGLHRGGAARLFFFPGWTWGWGEKLSWLTWAGEACAVLEWAYPHHLCDLQEEVVLLPVSSLSPILIWGCPLTSDERPCWCWSGHRTGPPGSSVGLDHPTLTVKPHPSSCVCLLCHGSAAAWCVSSAHLTALSFSRAILTTSINILKTETSHSGPFSVVEETQVCLRWDSCDYFRLCPRYLNLIFWQRSYNSSTAYSKQNKTKTNLKYLR